VVGAELMSNPLMTATQVYLIEITGWSHIIYG